MGAWGYVSCIFWFLISVKDKLSLILVLTVFFLVNLNHPTQVRAFEHPQVREAQEGGDWGYVSYIFWFLISVKDKIQLTRIALVFFLVNLNHPTQVRASEHPQVREAQEGGDWGYVSCIFWFLISVKDKIQLTRIALVFFLVNLNHPTQVR